MTLRPGRLARRRLPVTTGVVLCVASACTGRADPPRAEPEPIAGAVFAYAARSTHSWGGRYHFAKQVKLFNRCGLYRLACFLRPAPGRETELNLTLGGVGRGNFGGPIARFLELSVNGIPFERLDMAAEDWRVWNEGSRAGCDIALNFDGVRGVLTFYMRESSPVLWGRFALAEGSSALPEPTRIGFRAVPRGLIPGKFAKVYRRFAVTSARRIESKPDWQTLSPEDTCVVLSEGNLKLDQKPEYLGPCYLTADWTPIAEGRIRVSDCWIATVRFALKPGARAIDFGLWQSAKKCTDGEFLERLEADRPAFSLRAARGLEPIEKGRRDGS